MVGFVTSCRRDKTTLATSETRLTHRSSHASLRFHLLLQIQERE